MTVYVYKKKADNGGPLSCEIINTESIRDCGSYVAMVHNDNGELTLTAIDKESVSRINIIFE